MTRSFVKSFVPQPLYVFHPQRRSSTCSTRSTYSANLSARCFVSKDDYTLMNRAINIASAGSKSSFPNPSVGCLLVSNAGTPRATILGRGFHPKSGLGHGEVFALLEASKKVRSGASEAAEIANMTISTPPSFIPPPPPDPLYTPAADAFDNLFTDAQNVTAYTTLEPCSHVGRTPPCATRLINANVKRVVVGVRDPFLDQVSPTSGGGIGLLTDANVETTILDSEACREHHRGFLGRVDAMRVTAPCTSHQKKTLRKILNQEKRSKSHKFVQVRETDLIWRSTADPAIVEVAATPHFLSTVDNLLSPVDPNESGIVTLLLNNVVSKRKEAKMVGSQVASLLEALVLQDVGKTISLYRRRDSDNDNDEK